MNNFVLNLLEKMYFVEKNSIESTGNFKEAK